MATTDRTSTRIATVRNFLGGIYGPDLHAKRINALSAATLGVMTGASLAVAAIGQALSDDSDAVASVDDLIRAVF